MFLENSQDVTLILTPKCLSSVPHFCSPTVCAEHIHLVLLPLVLFII